MGYLTDQQLIDKFDIKGRNRVLDIGGSTKQHDIIAVDTIVDIVRPEEAPYWQSKLKAKHFVKLDITRQKLPFQDKEFDFCICTHTIEDIDTPFLIIDEMSRVAKRGYIAVPNRGKDTEFSHFDLTDWLSGPRRVPGLAHHQWFFEITGNQLQITPKNYPLLYTQEFSIVEWSGDEELQFYWENKINYKAFESVNFHDLIKNYRDFMRKNSKLIKKGKPLIFLDSPYFIFKELIKLILKKGEGFKNGS